MLLPPGFPYFVIADPGSKWTDPDPGSKWTDPDPTSKKQAQQKSRSELNWREVEKVTNNIRGEKNMNTKRKKSNSKTNIR